jgi:hypothetical protein
MVVHHVKVDHVGACRYDVAYFFTQAGEVGGQDAGSDAESGHGFRLALKKMRYFTLLHAIAPVFSCAVLAYRADLRCNGCLAIYDRQACFLEEC